MKIFDVVFENKADELAKKILAKKAAIKPLPTANNDAVYEKMKKDIMAAMVPTRTDKDSYYRVFTAIVTAAKEIADAKIAQLGLTGAEANTYYEQVKKDTVNKANAWMIKYYKISLNPNNTTTKEVVYTYKQGQK